MPANVPLDSDFEERVGALEEQGMAHAAAIADLQQRVTALEQVVPPPPTPIDCELGEWFLVDAGEWGPCQPDGRQYRSETWRREITVQPEHGGAPCGPLMEARIGSQACTYVPPPDPVDCVLSEWRMESAGPWGPCQPGGTQHRSEIWLRDIVTPPSGGGVPCGLMTETRTGTQACTYVPPEPTEHPYFAWATGLPQCVGAWNLRDQAQLDALVPQPPSRSFTYDPIADAARVILPATGSGSIPNDQAIRITLPRLETGTVIMLHDWQWDQSWRTNHGLMGHYKNSRFVLGGSHQWWVHMVNLGPSASAPDPQEVCKTTDEIGSGRPLPAGMLRAERTLPSGDGTFVQYPSYGTACPQPWGRWVRMVNEIRLRQPPEAFLEWSAQYLGGSPLGPNPLDPDGCWHMLSRWTVDAVGGVRRILYRVPMGWGEAIDKPDRPHWVQRFDFHMDSSKTGITGPLMAWARNAALLHNYPLPAEHPEQDPLFALTGF